MKWQPNKPYSEPYMPIGWLIHLGKLDPSKKAVIFQVLWVVKVERFQWNERPSCAHATSKVDQCCVQLVSSKLVFFSFWLFRGFCIESDFVWLRMTSYLGCVYTMFSWSHERTMKGNERKWKENERNMKANESKGLGFDTLWRRSIRRSDVVRTSFETATLW